MSRIRYLNTVGQDWCDMFHSRTEYFRDIYNGYISIVRVESVNKKLAFPVEEGELCLGDKGYTWLTFLPDKSNWCMTAMYNESGNIIEWYFDITKENGIDEKGNPYQDDLYLDVVLQPNGTVAKLDEDELQEALDKGKITKQEFDMAYEVCEKLISEFISVDNAVNSFTQRCFLKLNEKP